MRCLLLALLAGLAVGTAQAAKPVQSTPLTQAQTKTWSVGLGHALLWDGAPYSPIGLRVEGSSTAINKAVGQGFHDLCVELPAGGEGWSEAFQALQVAKCSFLVDVSSLAHYADGYAIEPEGFRISHLQPNQTIELSIPGASSVLAVFASSRDGDIMSKQRVATPGGIFHLSVNPPAENDYLLLLYPRMTSEDMPDYFEGLDKQRDRLLESIRSQKKITGLRGIVNPLGTVVKLPRSDLRFVPSSPYFQLEFREYLQSKYHAVETAEQSWSMRTSDIDTFDKLARLVPMWAGPRGVASLWDPSTDKLYPIENRNSPIWNDLQQVVATAARRRIRRLTDSIHRLAQVPVVQEWAGWSIPYEGGAMVDGIGMQTTGTTRSSILEGASRAASSAYRWEKPGWLLATNVDLTDAKPDDVGNTVDDLVSVGARGIFIKAEGDGLRKAILQAATRLSPAAYASDVVRPFFFPENALYPAEPQSLPNGVWWLPAPYDGNRLDFGEKTQAYRFNDGTGDKFVYWSKSEDHDVLLRLADPKVVTVQSIDGSLIPVKATKNGVEVRITSVPVLISGTHEIPVPDEAYREVTDHFAEISVKATGEHKDLSQETYVFKNDAAAFDRGPGGAYIGMLDQLRAVEVRLAPYSWIEGENFNDSDIGDRYSFPGCSGNSALRIATKLSIPGVAYRATYALNARTADEQEVWLAARVPAALRSKVKVLIGTQLLTLPTATFSPYGLGFAWYHLGVTRIGNQGSTLTIQVDGSDGVEAAFDVILLTNGKFVPDAVTRPAVLNYAAEGEPKKKKKR